MDSLKGKLTENEATEIICDLCASDEHRCSPIDKKCDQLKEAISRWKQKGLIKENPIDKAKKLYREWIVGNRVATHDELCDLIYEMLEAIKYLEDKEKDNNG